MDVSKSPPRVAAGNSEKASVPTDAEFQKAAAQVMGRCDALGEITDEPGRITRTFLSPATKAAHELVGGWMREAGLEVRIDAAGNVIGRREGAAEGAKTFVIGSHLDTVPNAGKYDGILGVMAGIAVAELTRGMALPFALEVVAFSEEEGVRFGKPYIGSHAYAGTLDVEWLELKDREGVTVEEAVRGFGLDPAPLRSLTPRTDLLAYLEIHIEQGPILESKNLATGIVTGIAAQSRMTLEITGRAAHAGTTPMESRNDALACAAEIILAIEQIGQTKIPGVATVGRIGAFPNASNVVPELVRISVDVRNELESQQHDAMVLVLEAAEGIAKRRGLKFSVPIRADFPPVTMNGASLLLNNTSRDFKGIEHGFGSVKGTHVRPLILASGAGHDAAVLAAVAPAAMLFVRSPGGVSHSPSESVLTSDVRIALIIACEAVVSLAKNSQSLSANKQEST